MTGDVEARPWRFGGGGTHLLRSPLPVHAGGVGDEGRGGQEDTGQHAQPEACGTRDGGSV